MEFHWYIFVFILGAIIGSFLNVVLYRLHTGKSLNGRSHCMSCGTILSWRELFPILSYLAQRGACKKCKAYIPSRYILVEVGTALTFVQVFSLFSKDIFLLILHFILVSILIIILVYDLRHMIIPDEMTFIICGLAFLFLSALILESGNIQTVEIMYRGIAGMIAAGFFAGLWYISKGRWIGLGDAKLAFPLGIFVGLGGVFAMIVFSFWIGAAVSLTLLAIERLSKRIRKGKTNLHFLSSPLTIKSEVPFAPFLIAGFLLVHLFHADIFTFTYDLLFR